MVGENRVRLRASCNACNESKVRCSQQKPICARCEHNKTKCIYGLSRRTHKDAPPILIPSSQRGRGPSRSGKPSRVSSSDDTRSSASTSSKSISRTTTVALLDEPAEVHNNHASLVDDFMFPTTTETEAAQLDLSNLLGVPVVTGSTGSMSRVPGYLSTTGAEAEYANFSTPWHGEFLFGANHTRDVGVGRYQALDDEGECTCTCHTGVTELLASMRGDGGGSNDQRPLDAQLAKLNQSIVACEASMACVHGREDTEPVHIMAIAMLLSYVIDGFKMLASESSATPGPVGDMASLGNGEREHRSGVGGVDALSSINLSQGGLVEPRLSWGVLELNDDDERDIRQRLYLLSFCKLERALARLTLHIRDLHIALASTPDPSCHLAFVIACDYTRLWLEKKVGDVKRLFAGPSRDDMIRI